MNLALNAAKAIGCVVTNVNAKDIIDGNPILILGLIWQIIRIQLLASISLTACPELVALLTEEEELEDLLALQPEAILLRWFNHHLEKSKCTKRVHNFGKDLADGQALSALLNILDPQQCDICLESNLTQRAQHIISNAQAMGVETFIRPNDITGANRKLMLAFVAQLFNTNPNLVVEATVLEEFKADFANLDLDDRGDTREEKVFRMWMNSLGIDEGALYISNLFSDIQDGVAILKVMDTIQPGIVNWKKVNINPKNRYKKVENGNYVIETARAMMLTIINIGGLDIIDGNKKMTLAIMWQLMRRHTLNLLQGLSKGSKQIEDPEIVKWANSKSVGMKIRNFSDSGLSSGVYLLKVCHGINKGVVNWDLVVMDATSAVDKINNAKYAISVARKLGALVFVAAEDIVEVRSRMIMLFCASLWHADNQRAAADAIEKEQAAADAINNANKPVAAVAEPEPAVEKEETTTIDDTIDDATATAEGKTNDDVTADVTDSLAGMTTDDDNTATAADTTTAAAADTDDVTAVRAPTDSTERGTDDKLNSSAHSKVHAVASTEPSTPIGFATSNTENTSMGTSTHSINSDTAATTTTDDVITSAVY
jgi:plastin-1